LLLGVVALLLLFVLAVPAEPQVAAAPKAPPKAQRIADYSGAEVELNPPSASKPPVVPAEARAEYWERAARINNLFARLQGLTRQVETLEAELKALQVAHGDQFKKLLIEPVAGWQLNPDLRYTPIVADTPKAVPKPNAK
jgi:hypothetical protein